MDGLSAIGSRIAEINAQLARLSVPATTPSGSVTSRTTATPPSATAAATSFDDVLAAAVRTSAPALRTTAVHTVSAPTSTTGSTKPTGTTAPTPFTAPTPSTAPTAATKPTAATSSTSRLTSTGAPVELARYGNGRIPAAALTSIGSHHRLWAPAAEAFQRLQAAAKRAGVHIGVTDSYRSYAEQVDVARRKGLHSQGGLAARPGTSEHGWGKSLDLALGADAQRWMRAHAGDYGFNENVSREPWHWTYAAAQ